MQTSSTCCSTVLPSAATLPPICARNCISILVLSVLPAPLSPLTKIAWLIPSLIICLHVDVRCTCWKHKNLVALSMLEHPEEHKELPVSSICNSKRMGVQLPKSHSFVLLHHIITVQMRQPLKGVHCYQNVTCIGLQKPHLFNLHNSQECTAQNRVQELTVVLKQNEENITRFKRHQ